MNARAWAWLYPTLLLVFAFPVCAEDWKKIGVSESGDRYFFDAASVAKSGPSRVTYWGKVEWGTTASVEDAIRRRRALGAHTTGYAKLKTSFAFEEVDCKARTTRNLASKDVDRNGKVLDKQQFVGQWDAISAGTVYEQIFTLVCH